MAGAVLAGRVAASGVPAAMTSLQNCGDTVSSEDSQLPHHCGEFGTVECCLLPVAPACPFAPTALWPVLCLVSVSKHALGSGHFLELFR